MLEINPQKASEVLLSDLPKRIVTVLEKRFGLGKGGKKLTLEAIGKTYGITRERVRQIERDGINRIKKGNNYYTINSFFSAFESFITERGGLVSESDVIAYFDADGKSANAIRFLLVLAPGLDYVSENDHFNHRWIGDEKQASSVESALKSLHNSITDTDKTFSKDEILSLLAKNLQNLATQEVSETTLASYVRVSRCIGENSFGSWGHVDSALIRPRGVRDMAYLVFLQEKKPLHFLEAAERIRSTGAKKRVHAQTVHNELIKDKRFVLVGRGMYGLAEWGYEPGTVRDIITRVLSASGPLSREEVIQQVMSRRQVKENTILINLQNRKFFKKLSDGRYTRLV